MHTKRGSGLKINLFGGSGLGKSYLCRLAAKENPFLKYDPISIRSLFNLEGFSRLDEERRQLAMIIHYHTIKRADFSITERHLINYLMYSNWENIIPFIRDTIVAPDVSYLIRTPSLEFYRTHGSLIYDSDPLRVKAYEDKFLQEDSSPVRDREDWLDRLQKRSVRDEMIYLELFRSLNWKHVVFPTCNADSFFVDNTNFFLRDLKDQCYKSFSNSLPKAPL